MIPHDPRRVVIGMGGNLGSREALLRAGAELLAATPGIEVVARSRLHATEPLGPSQPEYLNAAVLLRTALPLPDVLACARAVESLLGRERRERWGPRTLDLDILWSEGETFASPELTVPHAELLERPFALGPLLEVAPDARDLRSGRALSETLARLPSLSEERAREFGERFAGEEMEHTADEGFVVWAADRADALAAAAEALGALVVEPASVRIDAGRLVPVSVALDADAGDDERVFAWLSEVLYHVDARRFAVRRAVVFDDGATGVRGALLGEELDEARHTVRGALKAVTYHAMETGVDDDGRYRVQVVVDV